MAKNRPFICPICGNENIVEDGSGLEDLCAYVCCHCEMCGAEWEENFSTEYCGYNLRNEYGKTVVYNELGEEV